MVKKKGKSKRKIEKKRVRKMVKKRKLKNIRKRVKKSSNKKKKILKKKKLVKKILPPLPKRKDFVKVKNEADKKNESGNDRNAKKNVSLKKSRTKVAMLKSSKTVMVGGKEIKNKENMELPPLPVLKKNGNVEVGKYEGKIEIKRTGNRVKGERLERYEIDVDGARVNVEVIKEQLGISYNLNIPEISPATKILLDEIRNELIAITTISMKELTDPAAFSSIKQRFMRDSKKLLYARLPRIDKKVEMFLVGMLMQEMLGLGKIEFLVADPNLEEIVLPSAKEAIRVYSKKYGWLTTNIVIKREEEIVNFSNIIARRVGRQITVLNPLLDAHLVTGDRINAVLYPVNTKGNTITIRKFARDPFTIVDFIKNNTCDLNTAALLWLAVEFEMNVLISGGTGSGKTSFLNALMPFIPPNQRIISIEDTRELMLPDFLYWSPLVTRTPNPEGKGEVSMLDLLINSLRMRPDRIVLGEMRKQQEAMVLFEAMHTGHAVYATVHADSAAETISRLVNPPLNVPPNLLKAVNLNLVMFRDRKRGIRRVMQIAEFQASAAGASPNVLYRWTPETDKIVRHSQSLGFFEDVARNTGMSQKLISFDIAEKKNILSWLVKNNLRSLDQFGKVMNLYYRNREMLISAVKKGDQKTIFGK
jgi:archaeal flagellar protein FlaI